MNVYMTLYFVARVRDRKKLVDGPFATREQAVESYRVRWADAAANDNPIAIVTASFDAWMLFGV